MFRSGIFHVKFVAWSGLCADGYCSQISICLHGLASASTVMDCRLCQQSVSALYDSSLCQQSGGEVICVPVGAVDVRWRGSNASD